MNDDHDSTDRGCSKNAHGAPRSLLVRPLIMLAVTPAELHDLIEAVNARAVRAANCADQIDFADYLFRRVAELREAGR